MEVPGNEAMDTLVLFDTLVTSEININCVLLKIMFSNPTFIILFNSSSSSQS